jgi:hypothetical protein
MQRMYGFREVPWIWKLTDAWSAVTNAGTGNQLLEDAGGGVAATPVPASSTLPY